MAIAAKDERCGGGTGRGRGGGHGRRRLPRRPSLLRPGSGDRHQRLPDRPRRLAGRGIRSGHRRRAPLRRFRSRGSTCSLSSKPGGVHVLANRCTHRGAPLSDGPVDRGCITCPWHGSGWVRPRYRNGSARTGYRTPPVYETRIVEGSIEVRRNEFRALRTNSIGASSAFKRFDRRS